MRNRIRRYKINKIDYVKPENFYEKITNKYLSLHEIDSNVNIEYKLDKNLKLELEQSTFSVLFENLLWNAIKFSWKNANIEIGSSKNSFWIKDNGEWMDEEQLSKIWDKFYRNDTNTQWFWIWLFLVKRLVLLYWWHIWVESSIWKWTKFTINF